MDKASIREPIESGQMSIRVDYHGTPGELRKAKQTMKRLVYRLKASGVTAYGSVMIRNDDGIQNLVFGPGFLK